VEWAQNMCNIMKCLLKEKCVIIIIIIIIICYTPVGGPGVKNRKRSKVNAEWLEIWIVVLSEQGS